ncbi:HNH endonuclease [Burkholderia cenocepacia]|nr:HNH endonuclease [Burkholderia cenocepacia]RQZ92598.1 HNH endonuclease [Burkholderia cenocepacia]RRA13338.1 HNH endonuclease [Burkholderia cenocepacia]
MAIKLPDFLTWSTLNRLRHKMRAPLIEQFGSDLKFTEIELPVIERLQGEGIDVTADQIQVLNDGTLAYKGYRVLVYIRDIPVIGNRENMPKYHFSHCKTLETMYRNQRAERYVVANSDSGLFQVNVMDGGVRSEQVRLSVCQNCLAHIHWNGFDMQMARSNRIAIVGHFKLVDFFAKYPRDLMSVTPRYSSVTAPMNTYTDDWGEVSAKTRSRRGFKCEKCPIILIGAESKYLHVHHRNGQKHDNRDENLEVLCIGCHADEPLHAHMKSLPEYREFIRKHRGKHK